MTMNPTRSVLAVLGGFLLFRVISELLEVTLVRVVTDAPITDEASYFAARNQPVVLAAKVGYTAVAGLLAGYMTAKIATRAEIRHTAIAAAFVTGLLVLEFTGAYGHYTPVWMRIVLLLLAAPAMLAGGWVRASAAAAHASTAAVDVDRGTRS